MTGFTISQFYVCNIKGKWNSGRQPKTWTGSVKEDLKARNMDTRAAAEGTWGRQKWIV